MSTDYPPFTAPEVPKDHQDESIAKYDLPPCDVQEHLFVTRTYDSPLVMITNREDLDAEKLRAEIIMANYAAQVRYDNLPKQVKIFDRDVIRDAFKYQERNAKDIEF